MVATVIVHPKRKVASSAEMVRPHPRRLPRLEQKKRLPLVT
jgi:hypothetical protein